MSDKPPLKHLSPQEWEIFIDDFQYGGARREKWTLQPHLLLDLALSTLLKRDFSSSTKLHILVFLEEYSDLLLLHSQAAQSERELALNKLIEALRAVVQAPFDNVYVNLALKEQMMVSVTSILITISGDGNGKHGLSQLGNLAELLLIVINRPNHGLDRQTRAVACECLRELERAFPCLLSDISGHLWSLCQSERTHASQSYLLLFAFVIHNIVVSKLNVSILNTSVSLVPFNVPQWMLVEGMVGHGKEISESNHKELRRAMAFLLEWPQVLTPCGMMEFMAMIMPVAVVLELQASMLKVQFFGMIYSYDPMLCHVVLTMYLRFLDAFDGQEGDIARRLWLISREAQHYLVFRLLALHWLLGFIGLVSDRQVGKKKSMVEMGLSFYSDVFDPLALKSLQLDLLALCSRCLEISRLEDNGGRGVSGEEVASGVYVVKLFEDALVSVSAFKWLPPWSTETAVAFRTFHKFLIGASSHSDTDSSTTRILMESKIFHNLQRMLVDMILEFQRLVPIIVTLLTACWDVTSTVGWESVSFRHLMSIYSQK
ncbi:hypothetical protein L1049_021875 [Liquidambar formosana]|uniref:AP5B1 middle domain-containing protein n=1 Tax=Liquidambar formosana TaxID=63359 RepID=A0AAP0RCS2_LIQFO